MLVEIERIPRTDHLFQLLPHFRQLCNVEIRNVYRLWLGHGKERLVMGSIEIGPGGPQSNLFISMICFF